MKHTPAYALLCSAFLFWLAAAPAPAQQLTPDQMADMLLNSARKAFNEKQPAFAVQRFREFLGKYPQHKDIPAARFGLALALVDAPEKNYNEARELLFGLVQAKALGEQPFLPYHLGLAMRGQGLTEMALADAKPNEAPQRRAAALQRFAEAATYFDVAARQFAAQTKEGAGGKELPIELEWAARAICDKAEMFLRQSKAKEALEASTVFLAKGPYAFAKCRDQGRYQYGFAAFLMQDYAKAQQSLGTLTPFGDPTFGPHARYLLARTHHLAEERAEAALHYEGAVADYNKAKEQAIQLIKQQKFPKEPAEKAQIEALAKDPPPDHVARSSFYLGVLLYEAGRFGEAQAKFAEFPKLYPQSPFRVDAELRIGFCLVQTKNFPEAIKTLTPLVDREARVSDQALFWLARAQIGAAPDVAASPTGHQQAVSTALGTYRQAAERVQKVLDQDPDARNRRGLIFLEIADTHQHLKQYKEAANVYNQIIGEKLLTEREEETFLRLIQAQHLAGDYNDADKMIGAFQARFPKSTLTPHALFTFAENSYFRTLAAEKNPNVPERMKEVARLHEDTIKRFQTLIERYPEFPRINLARYSQGLAQYRRGELEKAHDAWKTIPAQDRAGDLAPVNYLMADCLVRLAPSTPPEDALAAGRLEEQLKDAAQLLTDFLGGQPGHPQTADALLKLGLCQQRLAGLMAQPADRVQALATARATYDRFNAKELSGHPLAPQAILERAKVIAQLPNEIGNAMNELRRFTNDPLKNAPVAPMALIQLATYLRGQNNAVEAVNVLAKARESHEGNLAKDPERSSWIILLRYHHGLALRETGKLSEARGVFDLVVKQGSNRPETAEASLRLAQCLKEEGLQKLDAARKVRLGAKKPEDFAQAQKLETEGYQQQRDAAGYLEGQAAALAKTEGMQEVRARMLYEAAWAMRTLSEPEIAAARKVKEDEIVKKLGSKAANLPPPNVTIDQVPLQPSEKKARELYGNLIKGFPDVVLAVEGRFELAELLAQRLEYDAAAALLNEALDKEPPTDMTEKIRLRLGALQSIRGNLKGALAQYDSILQNPKSSMLGWAHYQAGEALILNQQYSDAVKRLTLFRDNPQFQGTAGLSDRALLRLGHAYAFLKDWNNSRVAHERLVSSFPTSPFVDEARYGMGWSWQMQGQFDQAVNFYTQVTGRTATELAAKSQLQIGLCRLEQKRYGDAVAALLVVPFTYDYPELSAAAMLEAARALAENRQNDQAVRLLERVQREYPGTAFADAATERLKTLKR